MLQPMKIRRKSLRFAGILLGALACTGVQAADSFFDFDTSNPTNAGSGFIIAGGHSSFVWCSGQVNTPTNGNPATGGYLSIADGNIFNPGQGCVVVFPDVDGGYPIKAFHLTADGLPLGVMTKRPRCGMQRAGMNCSP